MSRGRKTKIEVDILKRMPPSILLQMTNKEVSEIFNVNKGQVSVILSDKLTELNRTRRKIEIPKNEEEILCHNAWMNSKERKFIKQLNN